MDMIIVGSLALDTIEAPAGRVENAVGGSATYASLAASYFTTPGLVGVVGSDFPEEQKQAFRKNGIDLSGLQIVEGKTFRWGGRYSPQLDQRETLFTELNVFESFSPELPEAYQNSKYVLLANIQPDLQHQVLDQITGEPFVVVDTMNLWINTALESLKRLLRRTHLLIVNDEEAQMLTGEMSHGAAARKLQHMGPKLVVIKKGQHGALLFGSKGEVFSAPALVFSRVTDPTGAGDAFAGGMLGYLANEQSTDFATLRRAVVWGSVMSSFAIQKFSATGLLQLKQSALDNRYHEFKSISIF
ncbi:MAG: bifunctional hydroxymethylpyrimidine kinase/phosphomethylpyrimidine kinase [Candidatus Marinimicrobia bacterium]|nr:bifunctional hydroxymethylpyrimidine kinase/phosphomethylpyrimidine kinase [Candidatus Neomarinimicrobiota bacterium]MCF7840742.1 bifunctional hydroxymethylpyrimidine kinase/phosphomethylpyrimidine kinase [Candidatus Neomarinimicrobiota bacterium]MCF7902364.1 bifunctional hydroxymethylpyrimidine kinase/phosphomethylpyrimidine kinase [Candidatus Neomarinimicrobiota bacterium]